MDSMGMTATPAHCIYWRATDLWSIIGEQALSYFAGDKPLDETVELIQSRVELYERENVKFGTTFSFIKLPMVS